MSLRFAILTGLNERPSTGLELARRFDRSIGYFWRASHQQIYRDLDALESDGLVAEVPRSGPPEQGRPRQFRITETGRAALVEWVEKVDEPASRRDALMVRVRAAAALGPEHVRAVVEHHLEVHERAVETYREIEARDFPGEDPDVRSALLHLVLRAGIETEEASARWCREVLEVVDGAALKR